MIYLVETSNAYKIGATKNINKRFRDYQLMDPDSKILLTQQGDYLDEQAIHHLCKRFRIRGNEWYEKRKEIIDIFLNYKRSIHQLSTRGHYKDNFVAKSEKAFSTDKFAIDTYIRSNTPDDYPDYLLNGIF